jgi:hypothetical protein
MNNKRSQAIDGEAKAKPKVIKLGLDLHVRQVTECRQLDGSTPKPGEKRRKYNRATEERILKALDEPPPAGYSRWNGRLLAEHLGQVSKDQVWRVMRKHHLSLARRQSWCVSTDPEFSRKAADVVGSICTRPRTRWCSVWMRSPAFKPWSGRRAGFACPTVERLPSLHTNTSAMARVRSFAALEVATGLVHAGHYRRQRRREGDVSINAGCFRLLVPQSQHAVISDNAPPEPNTSSSRMAKR